MTEQATRPETTATTDDIRRALLIYRVMAYITGIWLLALTVYCIIKWGTNINVGKYTFVPIAHGWFYLGYILATLNLAVKVRWGIAKIFATAIAGTIPFLSFVMEHVRTKEIRKTFGI